MEFEEFSGTTVDEAVIAAATKFMTTRDNVEYEVIEKEAKGFLGIGARQAKIKAKMKVVEQEEIRKSEETVKSEIKAKPEVKPEEREKTERAERTERRSLTEDEMKKVEEVARKFLSDTFHAMGLQVEIKIDVREDMMDVDLSGNEMGILIGKRGQTLDSLQYLLSLVVNKNSESYVKVKVDTENYRQRRRETLENLAKNIAFKVKRTKRPVSLEPMNPFERRVIHSTLQNDRYVVTKSEGEEPYRHVVVSLKK